MSNENETTVKKFADMTNSEKAAVLKNKSKLLAKRRRQLLAPKDKKSRKKRAMLLINYALMRLYQSPSKKNIEDYEVEILAWMEEQKKLRELKKISHNDINNNDD